MAGVVFPKTEKGDRSTTAFNKAIYGEMAKTLGATDLAEAIHAERDWRHRYITHLDKLVASMITVSATDRARALATLRAGLGRASELEFEAADGTCTPLRAAMASAVPMFDTAHIKGTGAPVTELRLPYNGQELRGAALEEQCDRWAAAGTMEPDCAAAIKQGARQIGGLAGRTFVVLGAGSELGPTRPLLEAGATVVAVATRRPQRWAELIAFARGTAGTLLIPVPRGQRPPDDAGLAAQAGVDLVKEAPAVAEWVQRCVREATGPVTVGTYLYADGEANVRLTVVSDFIVEAAAKLGNGKVSFAWLASCSTALVIPEEAALAQGDNLAKATWWQRLSGSPQKNDPVGPLNCRVHWGFESMQGPNYALAQSMRQWRAMLLHSEGFVVSTPVTPMCRTDSVCHNRTMATVLDGVAYTAPLEAFEPEACRAAVFGLLSSDLASPPPELKTPFHLFTRKSFHSGLWRCGFQMASLGTATWMLGKFFPRKVAA